MFFAHDIQVKCKSRLAIFSTSCAKKFGWDKNSAKNLRNLNVANTEKKNPAMQISLHFDDFLKDNFKVLRSFVRFFWTPGSSHMSSYNNHKEFPLFLLQSQKSSPALSLYVYCVLQNSCLSMLHKTFAGSTPLVQKRNHQILLFLHIIPYFLQFPAPLIRFYCFGFSESFYGIIISCDVSDTVHKTCGL